MQAQRVKESNRNIGIYSAVVLIKHLFAGGMLALVGTAGFFGALREWAWRLAVPCALLAAFGVSIIVIAFRRARDERGH